MEFNFNLKTQASSAPPCHFFSLSFCLLLLLFLIIFLFLSLISFSSSLNFFSHFFQSFFFTIQSTSTFFKKIALLSNAFGYVIWGHLENSEVLMELEV